MTKRKFLKLDNIEQDNVSLQSKSKKIEYNKNNIETILSVSTNKNVEVFLSYVDGQGIQHSSARDELIKQIKLHVSEQNKNIQHYLVVNFNDEKLVDMAYLTYSYKSLDLKLDIIPIVNHDQVRNGEFHYIYNDLEDFDVNLPGSKRYNELGITTARLEQVIEYTKLRIKKYREIDSENFEQYKSDIDAIRLMESSVYTEAHKEILDNCSKIINDIGMMVNLKELKIFKSEDIKHKKNTSNTYIEDYNDQDTIKLTGETE
ncbi:hypothetical protein [Rickettsia endosymbiont of Oedothorax gibbosus]|uniref:hypothetical protein n=1 Tax=Rickettsia endosymbiont of Oedothorax gibbosus TaxID=931099 RepID=UPI0020258244|nr:hypothetical protein [Rickettsia endosymbiont of Oedothorax gibbosus]